MFASFSRIKVVRSSLRRKKPGIRKGSVGIVIATSFPSITNTPVVPFSIAVGTVRAMFLRYGNEQKVRGEIREFINIMPCYPVGTAKEVIEGFSKDIFQPYITYLKETKTVQHIELNASMNSKTLNQTFLFSDHSHMVADETKQYPVCIAVNDTDYRNSIDIRVWVRTAAELIRRQIPFDDTLRIIHKCSLSQDLIPILLDSEKFNEFLRLVESDKGRQDVQEVIKSMNTLVQSHRRNQFNSHAQRLREIIVKIPIPMKEEKKGYWGGGLGSFFAVNSDAILESIFKTIYTYSTYTPEEIVKMNKPEFDKRGIDQRVLDAVFSHNAFQTIC
jgi:hypothetical protein